MGRIYSFPLDKFTLEGEETHDLVIAPVDTVVIREMRFTGALSTPTAQFLLLSHNGIDFQRWLLPSFWIGTLVWKGRLVATPGDVISFELGPNAGDVEANVSGYVLSP